MGGRAKIDEPHAETLISYSYLSPALSLVALIVASDRDSFDCGNVGVLLRCSRLISLEIQIEVLLRIGILI